MYKANMGVREVELMTAKEVMEWLKISESTLRRWTKEGILPYIKVQKKILYVKEDILKVLEKYRKGG